MYIRTLGASDRYSVNFFSLTGVLLLLSVPYWVNFYDDLQILSDKAIAAAKSEYLNGETEVFEFVIGN